MFVAGDIVEHLSMADHGWIREDSEESRFSPVCVITCFFPLSVPLVTDFDR